MAELPAFAGLFVAGNITGIESGKLAIDQGTTAGLSIATHAGKGGSEMDQLLEKARQNIRTFRQSNSI